MSVAPTDPQCLPRSSPVPDSPHAAAFVPASNVEPRPGERSADLLLLHYTGMLSAAAAIDWLTCAQSRVSCHYLVDEHGRITQMVAEHARAWHAGAGHWRGCDDINSCSIGIEIHNPGHGFGYCDFPATQMAAVAALCLDICRRRSIAPERVLAHSDVAPARKADPGERFDWRLLHRAGVGLWVEPAPPGADWGSPGSGPLESEPLGPEPLGPEPLGPEPLGPEPLGPGADCAAVEELQTRLRAYGYGLDVTGRYDAPTQLVVTAFQRHWRPVRVDGLWDASTAATLERLQRALNGRA